MTDESHTELNIWRDYERGKVGIRLEGLPQKLLSPDDARKRAAELEGMPRNTSRSLSTSRKSTTSRQNSASMLTTSKPPTANSPSIRRFPRSSLLFLSPRVR